MSAATVRSEFRAALAAAIAAGDVSAPFLEVVNVNVDHAARPEEWVTLTFYGDDELHAALGDEYFRETGLVLAHVFVRAGTGDARAVAIGDEIRGVFRAARLGNGVRVDSVSPPATGDGDSDTSFFEATVSIRYRLDLTA